MCKISHLNYFIKSKKYNRHATSYIQIHSSVKIRNCLSHSVTVVISIATKLTFRYSCMLNNLLNFKFNY